MFYEIRALDNTLADIDSFLNPFQNDLLCHFPDKKSNSKLFSGYYCAMRFQLS